MRVASIDDFAAAARRKLPRFLFEYLDGGSFQEITAGLNRSDLARVRLRQRVLRDVAGVSTESSLFGRKYSLPVGLGPVGLAGILARRGEIQAARAANALNLPFCLSTVSICSLSEVAPEANENLWFQLYVTRDRGFLFDMLSHAKALGVSTLVLTVDLPVPGARHRDVRSGLTGANSLAGSLQRIGQGAMHPRWAWDVGLRGTPHSLGNVAPLMPRNAGIGDFLRWMADNFDPSVTWADVEQVRANWSGNLVIKGVFDPSDAQQAVACGADGMVVSNHGGRQLDGVCSTAHALPGIADRVGGSATILADGGVRSGLDVIRLLALGAQGVLLGRAWAYALAAGGERAVEKALKIIASEIRTAMSLTGVTRVSEISGATLDSSTAPSD